MLLSLLPDEEELQGGMLPQLRLWRTAGVEPGQALAQSKEETEQDRITEITGRVPKQSQERPEDAAKKAG